jgi:hypothetical protein
LPLRARAVNLIHKSGISLRSLATELDRKESLLRRLLQARLAPIEDQVLARRGAISTNELIRRASAARTHREEKQAEDLERQRTRDAIAGSKTICDWISSEGLTGACGKQVVGEARLWLNMAEQSKQLPRGAAPAGMKVAEIIQRTQPAEPTSDEHSYLARLGRWLSLWAYYSFTDPWVRYKAIELALEKQCRR